jgi:rare lipoprotein A
MSAAHKTLPLPTLVEVENLENGRKVMVRVNDRGPFVDDRLIDLSHAAADQLGFTQKGLARVRVRYLNDADVNAFASLPGDRQTAAIDRKRAAPVPMPASVAVDARPAAPDNSDPIANLIAAEITPQVKPGVAEPTDMWVEVVALENLNQMESLKLDLPDLGPISIHSDGDGEGARRSLRAGPYRDESAALALLTRVQAAGFGGARIVRSVGG